MKSRRQQDQSPSKRSKQNKKLNSVERSKEVEDYKVIGATAECYQE